MAYDPVKAHEYYMRTRELKGRDAAAASKGSSRSSKLKVIPAKAAPKNSAKSKRKAAEAKVARLANKVVRIQKALKAAQASLSEKKQAEQKTRQNKKETEKKNSDGKSTVAEKLSSQRYRDKNKNTKKSEGGSSGGSGKKKAGELNVEQLETRVADLKLALKDAKTQLKKANAEVRSLKHSELDDGSYSASSSGVGINHFNQLRKETVKMADNDNDEPDFGGYATKSGIECADGLTIQPGAFAHNEQPRRVPLVYQHGHKDIKNILGYAILEHRDDGVYARGYFNNSEAGRQAREAVQHGDLIAMSIYANRLAKRANAVFHGIIREVSLVLAGANPGALIDFVSVRHSDGEIETYDDEAVITTGLDIEPLAHSDQPGTSDADTADEDDPEAIFNTLDDKQRELVGRMLASVADTPENDTADQPDDQPSETPENDAGNNDPDTTEQSAQHDALNTTKEGSEMDHNVFDQAAKTGKGDEGYELTHSDMENIFEKARLRNTTLKEVVEEFAIAHGIDNIDTLFPDAKAVSDTPEWIKRRTEWVAKVLGGTRHTPFSRIKSLSADLTLEQARAKGYIKGSLKKEEFFGVAKRVTGPQTIYKKQKLDRDDVLDITDFDVVAWIKGEMRLMLDEEIARAVLIGDGRSNADDDKIVETNIRPIATDHELYQTTITVNLSGTNSAEKIVDALLLNRRHYKGSGNPDLFTTELTIAQILNVKDSTGRRIYSNLNELATTLRVASIVPVEVMEEQDDLIAIMVNLQDYTIGADRGGDVSMFDDFDIDYNAYKYLIETRISGALTKPKSALVLRKSADNAIAATPEAPTWDASSNSLTVKDTEGLSYKNQGNGVILTPGTPVTLAEGQTVTVVAVPSSSAYYIESTENDEFTFTYGEGMVDGPH